MTEKNEYLQTSNFFDAKKQLNFTYYKDNC